MSAPVKPIVAVIACRRRIDNSIFDGAGEKYLRAVADAANCLPVILPNFPDIWLDPHVLEQFDGLFLTGSPSNVEPARYGGPAADPGTHQDIDRDSVALPLIPLALESGVPLFAVCRGYQELNVALGGSLHQKLAEAPGLNWHIRPGIEDREELFAPFHPVRILPGGLIQQLLGSDTTELMVNSVHYQGLDRLSPRLRPEALAPDGLVEAVSVPDAPAFALGVQWHPEWHWWETPGSAALLTGFGDACRRRAAARRAGFTKQTLA